MALYDRLRDGRIIGLLIEDIISYSFRNIGRVPGNGSAHDLVSTWKGQAWRIQCKSWNSSKDTKCSVIPSNMKGKGRKFDEERFLSYLEEIDAFLLCDVAGFPKLSLQSFTTDQILDLVCVSKSDAVIRARDLTGAPHSQSKASPS